MSELPVVVVGAGPVGLAAAAELVERGLDAAGAGTRRRGRVRRSRSGTTCGCSRSGRSWSPPRPRGCWTAAGWQRPTDAAYPTGEEWAERYLRPLAARAG